MRQFILLPLILVLSFSFGAEAQTKSGKSTKVKTVKPTPTPPPDAEGTPLPRATSTPVPLSTPAPVYKPGPTESSTFPAPSPTPADPVTATKSSDVNAEPTPGPRTETPVVLGRREGEPVPEIPGLPKSRTFNVGLSAMALSYPIPVKYGPKVGYWANDDWLLEASYITGTFGVSAWIADVGGFTETIISLDARYFSGKTFNWILGVGSQSYTANLGNELVSRFSGAGTFDVVSTRTLGANLGLGNRWDWTGITFGVDWLVVHIPLTTLKAEAPPSDYIPNQSDRDKVDSVLKFLRYIPTAQIARVSLGYEF